MKEKWYRNGLAKGILVTLAHVMAVLLVISMIWILACPSAVENVLEDRDMNYEESQDMSSQMLWDSMDILSGIRAKEVFETDGVYDGEKIVDVKKFNDTGIIDGTNQSGLAYKLEDLVDWAEDYYANNCDSYSDYGNAPEDAIIVCSKPDKTYEYYFYSELKKKIDDGELRFVMESEDMTAYDILQQLKEGNWYEGSSDTSKAVLDADNQVKYVDCWNYDGYWIEEKYAPVDAKSILEIANNNPEWNGKLSQAYDAIGIALGILDSESDMYDSVLNYFTDGNTNLIYLYADKEAKKVYTNQEQYQKYESLEDSVKSIKAAGKYVAVNPKLADFESNIQSVTADSWHHQVGASGPAEDFEFVVALDTSYPVQDAYYYARENYQQISGNIGGMLVMGIISAVILLVSVVWLTAVAGRRPEDEELHLHPFDRWKAEIAAALVIGVWIGVVMLAVEGMGYTSRHVSYSSGGTMVYHQLTDLEPFTLVLGGIIGFVTCMAFLIGYLSLVRRIKAGTLWKDSFLRWLIIKMRILMRHLPIIWKHMIIFILFVFSQFLLWTTGEFLFVVIGLASDAAAFIYILYQAVGRKRIREGIMHIAGGEVDYKIPLDGLRGDQLEIAERVNSIGEGLDAAVEASMKNERLKTDLITNVSHDIKTPLTSIINYIDLLKRENIQDEKIQGYLDVLEAKAQRLKTLTEDVVEASKVSSGNITLECMNLNLVEMVQQTSGEFAEKFE
ncbi:MAG: histidine kinase dimerization/phospho-acceptor domain-containing protein, partial [Eubacteriales bacterium]|nr:histidine kinase dimerization/phospho-acceptor domain-containing protein [Eubacteriales bacterium]